MNLKATLSLIMLEVKLYCRDYISMFFTFLLPVVLTVILGSAFGDEPNLQGYAGIDTIVAMNLVFLVVNNGIMGVTAIVAELKAKNTLKRYHSLGMSSFRYLNILYFVMLFLSVLSFMIFYTVALLFYQANSLLNISAMNLMLIVLFSLLSLYVFTLVGYLVTSLLNSTKSAMLIASGVFMVFLFASGLAIPLESFPPQMQTVLSYTPMSAGIKILVELWCNPNFILGDYVKECGVIIGWGVSLFGLLFMSIKVKRNEGQHKQIV